MTLLPREDQANASKPRAKPKGTSPDASIAMHTATVPINSAKSTQFLQVPKALHSRKARSRSRSRQIEDTPHEIHVPSDSQVIVSPQKLSFRSRSPPQQVRPEPFRRASFNGQDLKAQEKTMESPLAISNVYTMFSNNTSNLRITTLRQPPKSPYQSNSPYQHTSPAPLSPPLTPPLRYTRPAAPAPTLRSQLIGAWTLESYIAYPTPTSPLQRPTFPMTKNVTGQILYTPDGYMSAQMLIPGQRSFKRGEGDEAQWAEAGKRCFAYCGPYYISLEERDHGMEEVLRHTFQHCSLPGWVGDVQVRTHRFEEDGAVLVLGSEGPTEIKGDKRIPVLKWRRARDNLNASPPKPTPQIKISGSGEP